MKPAPDAAGCVVLLHGLGRSRASMAGMARYLRRAGYPVLNLGYPSRRHGIDHLVRSYLAPAVRRCTAQHGGPLHFVTHSLGGILLRHYLATHSLPEGSRAVLLAPPNRGSAVAEGLCGLPLPGCLLGPAARELGTGPGSVPLVLGPARLEIGVIAGTRSVEPWFGRWLAQASDGKVAPQWRALFEDFPERFMLGTDTYTPERWFYVVEHARWSRGWLDDLPDDLAENIAWRNAERLADWALKK